MVPRLAGEKRLSFGPVRRDVYSGPAEIAEVQRSTGADGVSVDRGRGALRRLLVLAAIVTGR